MAGRKKDLIWLYFSEVATVSGKGLKAKCKTCGKQIMGIVARMKKHKETCANDVANSSDTDISKNDELGIQTALDDDSQKQIVCNTTLQQVKRKAAFSEMQISKKRSMDSYVFKTSNTQKSTIDEQIARYVYATNSPFRCVEHKEFINMIALLRPGYTPPTRKEVGGVLLDSIYQCEREKSLNVLKGQTVSMGLDGWSNVHNQPIICTTVTTYNGDIYLIDSIDTSGHSHTAEYLTEIAKEAISKCETEFHCHVGSLVTDNAANVKCMREMLEKDGNYDILTYGCSAHLLNLLAHDLEIPNVKEHIVEIIKYFRNNHFAAAKYKEEGGLQLVLPQDVRWNTMFDCLAMYVKQWPVLMKICEEHRNKIDSTVRNKVSNFSIKRNAEDLLNRLEPIALSLDAVQKDSCTISRAVHIWKNLKEKFIDQKLDKKNMLCFSKRYEQALGPSHFLSYLIDPCFCGSKLEEDEKKDALSFANEKYPTLVPLILKFLAKADPFYEFLFEQNVVSQMSPLLWWWWGSHFKSSACAPENEKAIKQLLTAGATSASVERVFSTYGLVHSSVRNRMGSEKAAKLVFLYKLLNSEHEH